MTNAELIREFPKIGFEYRGITTLNGFASDLGVKVARASSQYHIPTTTTNTSIAIQEALFNLTNNVVVNKNEHWLQQRKIHHPLFEKIYPSLFPATDYIRRLFL